MPFTVITDPTQAVVDAIRTRLRADTALMALVTGVYDHVPGAARLVMPYLVLDRRSRTGETGAMQVNGSVVRLHIDGWSEAKGPYEMGRIMSRTLVLLERTALAVLGLIDGSLTCEFAEVFPETDEDAPERLLYHGVQRWRAEIHE